MSTAIPLKSAAAILNFRYTQMSDIVGSRSAELAAVDNVGVAFGILRLCISVAEL